MNHVAIIGRLTKDPSVTYTQGEKPLAIARYTLAVERKYKNGDQNADFISCVAFGKQGEFAEKYLVKGTKIAVEGRIQTGNYKNKEGQTVYTTDVVVDSHEFVESKSTSQNQASTSTAASQETLEGFMNVQPSDLEELPFA